MSKKKIYLSLIIFLALGVLSACVRQDSQSKEKLESNQDQAGHRIEVGGTIRIPVLNYSNLHPLYANNSYAYYFNQLIYDNLFVYGEAGNIESNLVEHYEISPDGLMITLTLRDNVYFHSGDKLTSDDVIYSFESLLASPSSPYHQKLKNAAGSGIGLNLSNFMTMTKFDNRNIDIELDRPYSDALDMLIFPVMKEGQGLENPDFLPDQLSEALEDFNPNGTGPYKLENIERNSHIDLTIHEDYHGRLPYIEKVRGVFYDDEDLIKLAFDIGQLDLINLDSVDWSRYSEDSTVRVEPYSSDELDILYFNLHSQIFAGEKGRLIRQAISRGINKKRIVDRVYLGHAQEAILPISMDSSNRLGLKSEIYYNMDAARLLLEEAGYKNTNDQGQLIDENGSTIDIKIVSNKLDPYKRIALDFIIEDLQAIGINAYNDQEDLNIDSISSDEKEAIMEDLMSQIKAGSFNLALMSVNLGQTSDMGAFLHSDSIESGLNFSRYSSIKADRILSRLKLGRLGEDNRKLYADLIELLAYDVPILSLYIKDYAVLLDSRIQGDLNPQRQDIYKSFRNLGFDNN